MLKILRPSSNLLPQAPRTNCNFSVFSCKQARSVGTENNDEWNYKDLQGMRRNPKSLKRDDGERKGILVFPSKLPHFSLGLRFHFRTASGQDGLNSFNVLLVDERSDFQRAKSREFSVTSVASVRVASDAISRSRKWLAKSICPEVLRERRSRMPVSIQAEPGGEEKWPRARWARQSSSRARFSCWL
jgi:hypothetical protein